MEKSGHYIKFGVYENSNCLFITEERTEKRAKEIKAKLFELFSNYPSITIREFTKKIENNCEVILNTNK